MTGQNIINATSVFSPGGDISANHLKEATAKNSFKVAIREELDKLEELVSTMVEKLDDISQRMGNAEEILRHIHK